MHPWCPTHGEGGGGTGWGSSVCNRFPPLEHTVIRTSAVSPAILAAAVWLRGLRIGCTGVGPWNPRRLGKRKAMPVATFHFHHLLSDSLHYRVGCNEVNHSFVVRPASQAERLNHYATSAHVLGWEWLRLYGCLDIQLWMFYFSYPTFASAISHANLNIRSRVGVIQPLWNGGKQSSLEWSAWSTMLKQHP